MKEERLRILRMIQDGTISASEGATLLAALSPAASEHPATPPLALNRRWLRIRVIDKASGHTRVNLSVPLALLEWGLGMAESNGGVNLAAIRAAIHGGAEGKVIEVDETESGERLEIFVE